MYICIYIHIYILGGYFCFTRDPPPDGTKTCFLCMYHGAFSWTILNLNPKP